ncbi:hypothetical protein BGP75_00750 [Motiliproteus sp. MSK22-1]|nr:hypothetical protein BGP75_00750 [Motiliproteus sp. MSK22-1]
MNDIWLLQLQYIPEFYNALNQRKKTNYINKIQFNAIATKFMREIRVPCQTNNNMLKFWCFKGGAQIF